MNHLYRFLRFPEGKAKAVTFSYDDGVIADARLAKTLQGYGLKGTFNVNGFRTESNPGRLTANEFKEEVIKVSNEITDYIKKIAEQK